MEWHAGQTELPRDVIRQIPFTVICLHLFLQGGLDGLDSTLGGDLALLNIAMHITFVVLPGFLNKVLFQIEYLVNILILLYAKKSLLNFMQKIS